VKLESLLQYLDEYLGTSGHPDYSTALNGLQVDGPAEVSKIVAAVDASQASISAAAAMGADLMIVHHGIFWDGHLPLTGRLGRRAKALFEADMALYSCHLPLDAHAEVGNCILLARAIGVTPHGRIGEYKGASLGWWGETTEPISLEDLQTRVSAAVGGGAVDVLPGGPKRIQRVGVLTGGGGSFAKEAAELGLDAFVTGEGSHHTYFDATEFGIHVLFAGHYATETFGVRALADHLSERFSLESHFVDQPTGL
jgi:dinuclear metal center YbgI/SA1388 family protein